MSTPEPSKSCDANRLDPHLKSFNPPLRPGPPSAALGHGWQTWAPRNAMCRLHRLSSNLAPGGPLWPSGHQIPRKALFSFSPARGSHVAPSPQGSCASLRFLQDACSNGEFHHHLIIQSVCLLNHPPCSRQGGSWCMAQNPGCKSWFHPLPDISILSNFVPRDDCAADCIHVLLDCVVPLLVSDLSAAPFEPATLRVRIPCRDRIDCFLPQGPCPTTDHHTPSVVRLALVEWGRGLCGLVEGGGAGENRCRQEGSPRVAAPGFNAVVARDGNGPTLPVLKHEF